MLRKNCKECGYVHIEPKPTEEHLKQLYEKKYYEEIKPEFLYKSDDELEWERNFNSHLYRRYKDFNIKARKLLDIGCGTGDFAMLGKELGWNVLGVEPSKAASRIARSKGLQIFTEFFTRQTVINRKFDVIHMANFLEHVVAPNNMVEMAHEILTPKGLLSIVVPNDDNELQSIAVDKLGCGKYWKHETHINYFTFRTMRRLLEKNNFQVVYQTTTFPMEFFLFFGLQYVNNKTVGKQANNMRMNFERSFFNAGKSDLLFRIYDYFAHIGIGRQVVMIAKPLSPQSK